MLPHRITYRAGIATTYDQDGCELFSLDMHELNGDDPSDAEIARRVCLGLMIGEQPKVVRRIAGTLEIYL